MIMNFIKQPTHKGKIMSEWITTPQSSDVAGFSYDEATQVLTVEFNTGSRYNCCDVPKHIFEGVKSADFKGKHINAQIKGHYRYARQ
jgi:hypothetical protein